MTGRTGSPPRLTWSNEQLRIYDDFLPKNLAEELLQHVNDDRYVGVHKEEWEKVFRLGDGHPLHGTTTVYRPDRRYKRDERSRYPTGTSVDGFIDAVRELLSDAEELIGKAGTDWNAMITTPWVYAAGAALSTHRDAVRYRGAYAYFLHRQWSFHWGGLLLVFDPSTPDPEESELFPPWLSEEEESRFLEEPGLATCILPKPNRLVFLSPSAYHMVTRVDANAGNRPRVSLAGFFLSAEAE